MKTTHGAFGGLYNKDVIKELRAELAKTSLILAALIDHTKTSHSDLQKIAEAFLREQEQKIRTSDNPLDKIL
tara:strand:+ start:2023 stop:2238 length:216 start_codon:yes stop_codon:yes gene_type:complete